MNEQLFWALGVVVVAAAVGAVLAGAVRLPSIAAFLVAGLLIGPLAGWVHGSASMDLVSELGIVLLLFIVGLELSFDKIRDVGRVALLSGLAQVLLTSGTAWLLCRTLGLAPVPALVLSVALTFSSTVVVVKIFSDKGELDHLHGRIAVGILLVQDLVVIVVLTVLSGLGRGDAAYDGLAVGTGIARAFAGMALLMGGVFVVAKWILPKAFEWAAQSPATVFIWSLFWCFALVSIAEHLGLSIELGAFFAGVSLAQLPYSRDLQHRIKPLMNFFVAVFFVSLGLHMTPGDLTSQWLPVAIISLFVLLVKPLILLLLLPRFGFSEKTAFLASAALGQISEFSFIFVALAASAGLVGREIVTITGLVGILTIAISSYGMLSSDRIFDALQRRGWLKVFHCRGQRKDHPAEALADHIIVVGMNTLGKRLAVALHDRGENVIAVDTDPRKLRRLPCKTHLGSVEFRDVLEEIGFSKAKLLISALRIEEANDLLAYRCGIAGVPAAIHAVDLSVVDNLLELGVAYLMLPKVDGVKLQNAVLKEKGVLAS